MLHAKLGDVYVIAGEERYPEALASYHAALSLNPASDAALTGLDRLEKLMAGVDPDLASHLCGEAAPTRGRGQLGARRRGGRVGAAPSQNRKQTVIN